MFGKLFSRKPPAKQVVKTDLSFDNHQRANHLRGQEIFPVCKEWSPMEWGCALGGECGELQNWLKKWQRDGSSEELRSEIGREIADIISYADKLASYFGLRTGALVQNKFNEVSVRTGVEEKHWLGTDQAAQDSAVALGPFDGGKYLKSKE